MLNLLIAILSDTYDKVQDTFEIVDGKELVELILETETWAINFNKNKADYKYLQVCEDDQHQQDEADWMGKVSELKKILKKQEGKAQGKFNALAELVKENKKELQEQLDKISRALNIPEDKREESNIDEESEEFEEDNEDYY